jgi:hypothetical protein
MKIRIVKVVSMLVLAFFVLSLLAIPQQNISALSRCFQGSRFGMTKLNNTTHHYVEFDVNLSAPDRFWSVSGPMSPSMWQGYYNVTHKRAGFRWPFNWPVVGISPSQFSACASW